MDKPGIFVKKPVEVKAIQFTGDNWWACRDFAGQRETSDGLKVNCFNRVGTYLFKDRSETNVVAELWVDANKTILPIEVGEWIIQDNLGFYPCKDARFQEIYSPVE